MALTKDDLNAVRSVIREETQDFTRKSDLASFVTKGDLLETARNLEAKLVTKEDLSDTEGRW